MPLAVKQVLPVCHVGCTGFPACSDASAGREPMTLPPKGGMLPAYRVGLEGFEPTTSALSKQRSKPAELKSHFNYGGQVNLPVTSGMS